MAQLFELPDGRKLDYLISGDKNGFPLIYIHGTPGALTPIPTLTEVCEQKGIKIISFSRAGYGRSSRRRGRKVVDEVADVEALKEHLGIKRCFIAGYSGGGPPALACAARLSGCVAALVIASVAPYNAEGLDFYAGMGEDNIEEMHAALEGEEQTRKLSDAQRTGMLQMDAEGLTQIMSSLLPDVDKHVLRTGEMGQYIVDSFHAGLEYSTDGWVDDNMSIVHPWGFNFNEIRVPVILYQGSEDKMVPYGHGQWLAEHIPKELLRKHLIEGQGHLSIQAEYKEKMIEELLEVGKS